MAMSTSPSTSAPLVGLETISSVMPGCSARKSRRIGMARRWANVVGSATFSTRFGRPFSLMTSLSAWSMRSKDLVKTGRMCRPASVSTNCCGRRSNRVTPRKFSRTMTWRLTALCATVRLFAAAVKLRCWPAASKARSALSGSHLRSIVAPSRRRAFGRNQLKLSDARFREPFFVKVVAHAGPIIQHDISVRADLQGFAHHVIASIHIPFGRIVGIFDERRVGEAGGEMGVGDDADSIGPSMRREDEIVLLRHQGDAAQAGQAADQSGVRLQHVEAAFGDQVAEFVELARHLAARDPNVGHVAKATHAVAVAAMQRLLYPIDAEPLQFPRDLDGVLQRPGRVSVPRHPPALIAVDHQVEPVADSAANRFEGLDVGAPIAAMEADLQGRKAHGEIGLGGVGELGRAAQRPRRRIGFDAVGKAADQLPAGLPGDLAGQVPEGDVERPERPQWKLILLSTRHWRSMAKASWPMKSGSWPSKPSIMSPEPIPVTPRSVWTRTIAASQ